jgi:RimJ/RimL family protein N-acetyltransferase
MSHATGAYSGGIQPVATLSEPKTSAKRPLVLLPIRLGSELSHFTVYDRSDQAPIGFSSLFRIDHRVGTADFGIFLGERRGKGLGTEATRLTLDWGFTVLGLHNVMLGVAAWNERAIRVYAKAGFRELGRRRGAGVTMGRRYDGVLMELLASEFLQAGGSVLAGRAPRGEAPAE